MVSDPTMRAGRTARVQGKRAAIDDRAAGEGVKAPQAQRSGRQNQPAAAADHASVGLRSGCVDSHRAAVADIAHNRPVAHAIAELQRARRDRGPARIGIRAVQSQRNAPPVEHECKGPGTILHHPAEVARGGGIDRQGNRACGAAGDRAGQAIEARKRRRADAGQVDDSRVGRQPSAAQGAGVAQLQDAARDVRAAAVAVGSLEQQAAAAGAIEG